MNDLNILTNCLPNIGLELVTQTTFHSYTDGKCEFAIRIPGNHQAYEVGVVLDTKTGEYNLLFDHFCGAHGMEAVVGRNCEKIIQAYKAELARTTEDAQRWVNEQGCVEHLVIDPVSGEQYLVYENENMADQDVAEYILQQQG